MYEITYITKDEKEGATKELLTALKAKIVSEDSLGRRRFAYKFAGETAGFYTTIVFEIDPQKLNEFSNKLKLENGILRYLIIKKIPLKVKTERIPAKIDKIIEEKPAKIAKVEKGKKIVESEATDQQITGSVTTKPKKAKRLKTEHPAKEEIKTKKVPKKEIAKPAPMEKPQEQDSDEERLKKLDEKLDELLKE